MLEHRHMLDRAGPGAADRGGGAPRNPEQPRQPVGREADHHIVEPAPTLVAREQRRIAEIEPEPRTLNDHFGQRRDVAPAKVEPLRSEEHTSELQSLMRNSYAVF